MGKRALIAYKTITGSLTIFIERSKFWYQISLFPPSLFFDDFAFFYGPIGIRIFSREAYCLFYFHQIKPK